MARLIDNFGRDRAKSWRFRSRTSGDSETDLYYVWVKVESDE